MTEIKVNQPDLNSPFMKAAEELRFWLAERRRLGNRLLGDLCDLDHLDEMTRVQQNCERAAENVQMFTEGEDFTGLSDRAQHHTRLLIQEALLPWQNARRKRN